jgi:hypothetical protein
LFNRADEDKTYYDIKGETVGYSIDNEDRRDAFERLGENCKALEAAVESLADVIGAGFGFNAYDPAELYEEIAKSSLEVAGESDVSGMTSEEIARREKTLAKLKVLLAVSALREGVDTIIDFVRSRERE